MPLSGMAPERAQKRKQTSKLAQAVVQVRYRARLLPFTLWFMPQIEFGVKLPHRPAPAALVNPRERQVLTLINSRHLLHSVYRAMASLSTS